MENHRAADSISNKRYFIESVVCFFFIMNVYWAAAPHEITQNESPKSRQKGIILFYNIECTRVVCFFIMNVYWAAAPHEIFLMAYQQGELFAFDNSPWPLPHHSKKSFCRWASKGSFLTSNLKY